MLSDPGKGHQTSTTHRKRFARERDATPLIKTRGPFFGKAAAGERKTKRGMKRNNDYLAVE